MIASPNAHRSCVTADYADRSVDDSPAYPQDRLGQMLDAAENPNREAGGPQDAPPAVIGALQDSATAYFAALPTPEQVTILRRLPESERDGLLAELREDAQRHLRCQLRTGPAAGRDDNGPPTADPTNGGTHDAGDRGEGQQADHE